MKYKLRTRRLILAVVAAIAAATLVTGCVAVPTSGKVEQARHAGSVSTEKNEIVPKPPAQDATAHEIVVGFLSAMASYQSSYRTARKFLSSAARDNWRPEDGATIYKDPQYKESKKNVKMSMNESGRLGENSNYKARSGRISHNFKIRRTRHGQLRISNPPDGLMISENNFNQNYDAYNVYYFDPQFHTLVPEPIYLPAEAETATALVKRLLAGPSDWLRPAVSSTIPPKTSLITNSVPVENGRAKLSLSDTILDLDSRQRKNLAVQIAWTLKQVDSSDITEVQITVDGDTYHIPGEQKKNGKTFVSADIGQQFDPISKPDDKIAGIHQNRVASVDPSASHPKSTHIGGPLGNAKFQIDSVALAPNGKSVAAVTGGRGQLRTQSMDGAKAGKVLDDQQRLLRPDFARKDELWSVSGKTGKQRISAIQGHHVRKVRSSWLSHSDITAFRISPDGSRFGYIDHHHGEDRLVVAPIVRGEHWRLGKRRRVQVLDNAPIDRIADLGWISPTRLMIIGASGKGGAKEPYRVEIDGSEVKRVGFSHHWGASSMSAVPESSDSFRAIVGGRQNKVWIRRSKDRWKRLVDDLAMPTYAG